MVKRFSYFITAILTALLLIGTVACGSTDVSTPNIVGKWVATDSDVSPNPGVEFKLTIEFFEDGTYSFVITGEGGTDSDSGEYSFPNDTHIRMKSPSNSETDTFQLSGNTMMVTKPGGGTMIMHRKN